MPTYETIQTIRPGTAEDVKRIIAELPEGQELHRSNVRYDVYNIVRVVPDAEPPRDLYDTWSTEQREASPEELAEVEAAQKTALEVWQGLQAEAQAMPAALKEAIALSDAETLTTLSQRKAMLPTETLLAELRYQESKIRYLFAKSSWMRAEEIRSRTRCYQPSATTEKAANEQRLACAQYHSLRGAGMGMAIGEARRRMDAIRSELGR
jgi:hypothetical protein